MRKIMSDHYMLRKLFQIFPLPRTTNYVLMLLSAGKWVNGKVFVIRIFIACNKNFKNVSYLPPLFETIIENSCGGEELFSQLYQKNQI